MMHPSALLLQDLRKGERGKGRPIMVPEGQVVG